MPGVPGALPHDDREEHRGVLVGIPRAHTLNTFSMRAVSNYKQLR